MARTAPSLDRDKLKRLLSYDPDTGLFRWLHRSDVGKTWNARYAGKVAGYDWKVPNSGLQYRSIRIFDWPFLAHRLAWLYMTGAWPDVVVDHKDRDGLNNRWGNLRAASRQQNSGNAGATKANRLGVRGVSLHKTNGRYRAVIWANNKQQYLGHFRTIEEASAAYEAAAAKVFGEFAVKP